MAWGISRVELLLFVIVGELGVIAWYAADISANLGALSRRYFANSGSGE